MSTVTHIHQLQQKRDNLKSAIKREIQSPFHSDTKILSMKKQRLHLKDEIAMLERKAS